MTLVNFFTIDSREIIISDVLAQRPAFIIGSDSRGHLLLHENGVAPAHALVTSKQSDCFIQPRFPNLDVLVNGKRISTATRIQPGDSVQIGDAVLIFGQEERQHTIPPLLVPVSPAPPKPTVIIPRPTVVTTPHTQPIIHEVYLPQPQSQGTNLPALVLGAVTVLIIMVVVGFGIIGSGLGGTQVADTHSRFAYNDGNISIVMFDADW